MHWTLATGDFKKVFVDLKWLKLHKHAMEIALPVFAKLQLNLCENDSQWYFNWKAQ